jgi:hypothetical protein
MASTATPISSILEGTQSTQTTPPKQPPKSATGPQEPQKQKTETKPKKPAPKAAKTSAAAAASKPNKYLPTDRITFIRQLDILRGWAAASGPNNKIVTNDEAAGIVKMATSTLSMNNAFYMQSGLLVKTDGGFIPAPDVFSFLRAYEWSPESAASKLAPIIAKTWFADALLPKLAFGPISTDEAIQRLADVCNAGPDYRGQLRFLLEYLTAAGLTEWDGNQVRKGSTTVSATTNAPNTDIPQTPSNPPPAAEPSKRVSPTFFGTTEGAVNFNVSVRVDMGEFASWKPERIAAFFNGMAQVLAAKADVEKVNEGPK